LYSHLSPPVAEGSQRRLKQWAPHRYPELATWAMLASLVIQPPVL